MKKSLTLMEKSNFIILKYILILRYKGYLINGIKNGKGKFNWPDGRE